MQGQRGIIGSLPETLEFDHGSASGNAIMDQPMCWNIMQNPAENQFSDFMLSPSHMNAATYVNSDDQERKNLSNWSLGEASSSGAQKEVSCDEQKTKHVWASSASTHIGSGSRLEEMQYESRNINSLENVNVNPQSLRSSNSIAVPPNLNLNTGFVDQGIDNCQLMQGHNMYKSSGTGNNRIPSASGSDALVLPSGSGGYLLEENDGRLGCSLDVRRHSCKRKAVEGNIGQSSMSGSSSFFLSSESSVWPGVDTHYDSGSILNVSAPSEQEDDSLVLGARGPASESVDSAAVVHGESSRRNFRLRMNPSNQEPAPPTLFPVGGVIRRSSVPSFHQSSRLVPADHSMEFRSSPAVEGTDSRSQPVVIPVPALPQNGESFRWNGSSPSRVGSSSTSINLGDREETSSRNMPRNLWQHPVILPPTDLRTSVRNSAVRSASGGSIRIPGNVASTLRTGSSSSVPVSAPALVSPQNPSSRYSRRMAEYVRRSLFSASGAESGGSNSIPHSGLPFSSEEAALSSVPGNRHRSNRRLSSWMERHGDSVLGIPYPLRTLTAAGEGRSRLVSEQLRNVLDLMRRGESLRFEDVMILDQSVFFGMADIHDQHRDMRLDVDNMSYEELLALEERIGNVNTGLSEETIVDRLKQHKYIVAAMAKTEAGPCCICREEYIDGEDMGTLDCGHEFHCDCIKEWLKHKNLCPICKTTGLAT